MKTSCLSLLLSCISAYHIAVSLNFGSISHVLPYFEILHPMIDKGNTVTYLSTNYGLPFAKNFPKITTRLIEYPDESLMMEKVKTRFPQLMNSTGMSLGSLCFLGNMLTSTYLDFYTGIQKFDREQHIDLLVCNMFNLGCIDYGHTNNKRLVILGPLGFFGIGQTYYVPDVFTKLSQEQLLANFFARNFGFLTTLPETIPALPELYSLYKEFSGIKKQAGIHSPFLASVAKQHLYFAHNVFGLVKARELPPNIIPVGPILPPTIKPLGPEMKEMLDNFQRNGTSVVYIAFGSAADISGSIAERIYETAKQLLNENEKLAVIWPLVRTHQQFESPPGLEGRFIFKQWVNQRALLQHSAVKLFLTHGGASSVHEGMFAGVPMIVTGIFADQFANARSVEEAHLGYTNDKFKFTPEQLKTKITKLLQESADPSSVIHKSVEKMKVVAKLNSETHVVTLTNLFEMAATVGYDHLVPITARMTWWQLNGQYYAFLLTTIAASYPILKYAVKGLKLRKSMK
ncbi:hypothetical protein HDV01_003442 [Terramyces sp. JEL0728]|nr:hypothetical protein HDV01_003442 [Terramyces sp. JEL0728]